MKKAVDAAVERAHVLVGRRSVRNGPGGKTVRKKGKKESEGMGSTAPHCKEKTRSEAMRE